MLKIITTSYIFYTRMIAGYFWGQNSFSQIQKFYLNEMITINLFYTRKILVERYNQ